MANAPVAVRRPGTPLDLAGATRRARAAATTTPGRLRLLSLVIVAGLLVLAVVGVATVSHRRSGLHTVEGSEPLIADAQQIDTSLSAADAAGANAFLSGGIEPASLRNQYQLAIGDAAAHLNRAAGRVGTGTGAADTLLLAQQIPVYTGLIETARANNRQGFPVGAAYLRQANHLLTGTILPATQHLYQTNASRLEHGRQTATAFTDTISLELAAALAAAVLVLSQMWIRRRSHRLFNVPLLAATVLALAVSVAVVVYLRTESAALRQAHDRGAMVVDLVSQARTAAFTAKSDESLTLIGRGNGAAFDSDFNAQATKLDKLLGRAQQQTTTADAEVAVNQAVTAEKAYLAVHRQIRTFDDGGHFDQAVKLAVGTGPDSANAAFDKMDSPLRTALAASQTEFEQRVSHARSQLAKLSPWVPLVLVLAGLLALFGVQQRINEYR